MLGPINLRAATQKPSVKWIALLITSLAAFLTPFMLSATTVALPSIGAEFSLDTIFLGWIQTSYLLSSAVVLVPIGRIADIKGRKAIFLIGVALYTMGCFATPLATNGQFLIVMRMVQGVGGAMTATTSTAILTSVFPPGETGKAFGINAATLYAAIALGPFIGGILTTSFGWRSIFFFSGIIGVAVLILTIMALKGEWAEARGKKFDPIGSVLYAVALTSIMIGALALTGNIAAVPFGLIEQAAILLGGGALLIIFVAWELKSDSPVLDIGLFKNNRVFALSNLAALISYAATYAVSFFISLFLQDVRGFIPALAGTVLLTQPLMQAALSPAAGWLSDRASPQIVASLGIGIDAAGLFMFSTVGAGTEIWFIISCLAIMGVGFALFSAPNMNAIMTSVEKQHYGTSSAILSTMRQFGQVLSMTIAMIIISTFISSAFNPPASSDSFVRGMQIAFILFGTLCVLGTFASIARGKGNTPGQRVK